LIGLLLALGGAILLAVLGETGLSNVEGSLLGYLLILVAMLFTSTMTIYTRKFVQGFDSIDISSVRMLAAAFVVMPLSLIFVGFDLSQVNFQGFWALIYASIFGTFLGMLVSLYNIQKFGATASVMAAYIIPIVATLAGAILLNEQITPAMLGGMAIIFLGVGLINWGSKSL
jgi:drug/metabolite transporter (DMT)-like permease